LLSKNIDGGLKRWQKADVVKKLFTIDPASQQSLLLAFLVLMAFIASTIPRNERALFVLGGTPVGAFAATPETEAGPNGPAIGYVRGAGGYPGGRGGLPRGFGPRGVGPLGGAPRFLPPTALAALPPQDLPGFGSSDLPGAPLGALNDGGGRSPFGPGPASPLNDLPGGDVGSIPRGGLPTNPGNPSQPGNPNNPTNPNNPNSPQNPNNPGNPNSPVGPVPEPETWVLMLAGSFFVAGQLRRARRLRRSAGLA
jgi:hypothetical protein